MNEKQIELYKQFIMRKNVHVNMSEPDSRNLLKAHLSSLLMNSGVNHIVLTGSVDILNRLYIQVIESICTKKPLSKCSISGVFMANNSSIEIIPHERLHDLKENKAIRDDVLVVVLDRLHISDDNRQYTEDNFNSIIGYQS